MKVHFIAIGGSIMHGLAISLKEQGHEVSGSDDAIYDPARSKLAAHDLLPEREGWDPNRIQADTDAVILGMHAFEDNPEWARAKELDVPLYSFPEFIYQQSQNKQRIAICGSYGKTTITAMVMHALHKAKQKFDYLVGGQVPGFDNSVKLTADAPILLVEGDEYLASKQDPRPKFLLYKPHMVVISGISWDHINVFPTEDQYVDQFRQLLTSLGKAANVIYNEEDGRLSKLVKQHTDSDIHYLYPYKTPRYKVQGKEFRMKLGGEYGTMGVFGKHNMANLAAAWQVCELLGIREAEFLAYMADFTGSDIRLQVIHEEAMTLIRDYAHAPAKVQASVQAVRERYPKGHLISCLELHTFSSLNKDFISNYAKTLAKSDVSIVLVDPHALEKRRMPAISREDLVRAFGDPQLIFVQSGEELAQQVEAAKQADSVLLMMSSGNFDGLNLRELVE
jgi:UDP-N-acetylmuramate: L-alanyl-gamma-D-glutamyl-meso-diaminopimelate ligase